jgi:hypothetical protein
MAFYDDFFGGKHLGKTGDFVQFDIGPLAQDGQTRIEEQVRL